MKGQSPILLSLLPLFMLYFIFFPHMTQAHVRLMGELNKGVWYTIHGKCNTYIWELILPSDLRTCKIHEQAYVLTTKEKAPH